MGGAPPPLSSTHSYSRPFPLLRVEPRYVGVGTSALIASQGLLLPRLGDTASPWTWSPACGLIKFKLPRDTRDLLVIHMKIRSNAQCIFLWNNKLSDLKAYSRGIPSHKRAVIMLRAKIHVSRAVNLAFSETFLQHSIAQFTLHLFFVFNSWQRTLLQISILIWDI